MSSFKQIRPDATEGLSIPDQRLACQQKAAQLGAEVVMEYVERKSAKSARDRPALQRMLADLRTRRDIDYVIVWKVERFARKRYDEAIVGQEIEDLGIEFISASEGIDNSPAGRFLRGVLASHAEYDNAIRAERARMAMTRKAELGGTPYKPPPGYRLVSGHLPDGRRFSRSELDPAQAPLMALAFRRYSQGDLSLARLADELYDAGLRSVTGNKLGAPRLHDLLQNPYYLGKVPFRGAVYDGKHDALVDQRTFDRVQLVMRAHATSGERRRTHNHFLKGSVFCGHCGRRLVFNLAAGNGGHYPYFFCVGRRSRCKLPHLRVKTVEQEVARYYATIQLSAQAADRIRVAVITYLDALRSAHDAHAARYRRELATVERKRDKLFEAYAADAVSLDQFRRKQKQLDAEAASLASLIDIASDCYDDIESVANLALDLVQDAPAAYENADELERRLMNQALFEKLLITEDGWPAPRSPNPSRTSTPTT